MLLGKAQAVIRISPPSTEAAYTNRPAATAMVGTYASTVTITAMADQRTAGNAAARSLTWLDITVYETQLMDVLQTACNVQQDSQQYPQVGHYMRSSFRVLCQLVQQAGFEGRPKVACKDRTMCMQRWAG